MICVDASVAAKWLFEEVNSERADALAAECTRTQQVICAPLLLRYEIANIIRQRMIRERRSLVEARELFRRFLALRVKVTAPRSLHLSALALTDAFGLPAAYDAHYVALAQALRCDLWTDDQRLLRDLAGKLSFVRWIGDFTER